MYGMFTYIWVIYGVNVGKYTIHGASGIPFPNWGSSDSQDSLGWKRWYSEEKAENADLPRSARDLNQFQRLFLLRVMRQDRAWDTVFTAVSWKG